MIWINKTPDSCFLSNSRSEKDTYRQIRTHASTIGHKSSRVKRFIKAPSVNPIWAPRYARKGLNNDLPPQSSSQKRQEHDQQTWDETSNSQHDGPNHFVGLQKLQDHPSYTGDSNIYDTVAVTHPLSSAPDPFSSYSIELDPTILGYLWYFENIWTNSAFKLPGCEGTGQRPVEKCEVTALIQKCLGNTTRAYSLLAAISAREQFIHQDDRKCGYGLAHTYASRALHGIRQRMFQSSNSFSEDDWTDVIFLATYELFCSDKLGAGKHLTAVRRLYKQNISNTFVRRLQANLEVLVEGIVAERWHHAIDRLVQPR